MRLLFLALLLGGCQKAQPEHQANSPNESINSVEARPTVEKQTASPRTANDPNVTLGRCHMDSCSWYVVEGQSILGRSEYGTLVRLNLRGGESANIVAMSDEEADRVEIRWNEAAHDVYVLCSKQLPAVAVEQGAEFQVDVLDFARGVPAVLQSSVSLYGGTCHLSEEDYADSYGPVAPGFDEIEIQDPSELLDHAKQAANQE